METIVYLITDQFIPLLSLYGYDSMDVCKDTLEILKHNRPDDRFMCVSFMEV